MSVVGVPKGLGRAGAALWRSVSGAYEMAEHEAAQLEEACRVRDTIVSLRAQVAKDGVMIRSSQGERLHPAIVEIRQQQLALARLLVALGVAGLEDEQPDVRPVRAVRGVYAPREVG